MTSSAKAQTLLDGRYVLERMVYEGGMGAVYRAFDQRTEARVAIKLIREDFSSTTAQSRFRREIATIERLHHPGVVAHLGHGFSPEGHPFLVMEWIEGESLSHVLGRRPLSIDEVVVLLRNVADGLAVAHREGIVHRDLKPSNLMLRNGRLDHVVIIDFGVARRTCMESQITKTGALVGTPVYMAPEQARGARELPLSVDVFALGCVAFRCLVGHSPFAADNVVGVLAKILFEDVPSLLELRPEVPVALAELIGRMLSRDADARPADAEALGRELVSMVEEPSKAATLEVVQPPTTDLERQVVSALVGSWTSPVDPSIEVLGAIVGVVTEQGGRAEWLLDDSLVAAFSTGLSATDRAAAAARCALALRQRWPSLDLAIATGSSRVRGGLPIGEAVDEAHELLALRPPGAIWLDDITSDLLDGRFDVASADQAHRLSGERPPVRDPRRLLGRHIPCLGRRHELGILDLTLHSCIEEQESHLVIVSGEIGYGKSRLRHEFLRKAHDEDEALVVLFGEGDPMTIGSPYAIIGRAIRRIAGLDGSERPEAQRDALEQLLAQWVPEVGPDQVDFLAEVCAVPRAPEPSHALRAAIGDPKLMRHGCIQIILTVIRAAMSRAPTLVVVEDLHWGDALTVEVLLHAHAELADGPLMIVMFTRPDAFERFSGLERSLDRGRNCQHVRLRGLGRGASSRLIHEALADVVEVTPTLVEDMFVRSSGNPLYLEELVRAAARGGVDDLPPTVVAMLQARIEQVEQVARHLLLAASVVGRPFRLDEIASVLGDESPETIRGALDRLVGLEMLERSGVGEPVERPEYRFRHALLRDAAYGLLSPQGARHMHMSVAEAMIEREHADEMLIADHLFEAGLQERAAAYYLRAAEQASVANAHDETLRRASKGLQCNPSGVLAGHLNALQAWAYAWRGQWDECVPLLERTLAMLPVGSHWWCRCAGIPIVLTLMAGDEELLERQMERLLGAEPGAGSLVSYLDAVNIVIGSATTVGRYRLAERCWQRAQALARAAIGIDDDVHRLLAFGEASVRLLVELDVAAALTAAESTVALARSVGDGRYASFGAVFIGLCHERMGDHATATRIVRETLERASRLDNPYLVTYTTMELAGLLLRAPVVSPEACDEALALASGIVDVAAIPAPYPGWAHVVRAEAWLDRGEPAKAEAEAQEAIGLLDVAPSIQCRGWLVIARCRHAVGAADRARRAAEVAITVIEQEGGWDYIDALAMLAWLEDPLEESRRTEASVEALARYTDAILGRIGSAALRTRVEAVLRAPRPS